MNIPAQVHVGIHTYTIIRERACTDCAGREEKTAMDTCMGCQHPDELEIRVAPDIPDSRAREVFMHECLHAIEDYLDLNTKERDIHALAEGLLLLFHQNPGLVETLRP